MSKHECLKCGYKTTQPLPSSRVAHPCPKRRQGDHSLVWLVRVSVGERSQQVAA